MESEKAQKSVAGGGASFSSESAGTAYSGPSESHLINPNFAGRSSTAGFGPAAAKFGPSASFASGDIVLDHSTPAKKFRLNKKLLIIAGAVLAAIAIIAIIVSIATRPNYSAFRASFNQFANYAFTGEKSNNANAEDQVPSTTDRSKRALTDALREEDAGYLRQAKTYAEDLRAQYNRVKDRLSAVTQFAADEYFETIDFALELNPTTNEITQEYNSLVATAEAQNQKVQSYYESLGCVKNGKVDDACVHKTKPNPEIEKTLTAATTATDRANMLKNQAAVAACQKLYDLADLIATELAHE